MSQRQTVKELERRIEQLEREVRESRQQIVYVPYYVSTPAPVYQPPTSPTYPWYTITCGEGGNATAIPFNNSSNPARVGVWTSGYSTVKEPA